MAKGKGKVHVTGEVKMSEVREIVIRLPKGKEIPVKIEFFDPDAAVQGQSGGEFLTLEGGTLRGNCGCGGSGNCIC